MNKEAKRKKPERSSKRKAKTPKKEKPVVYTPIRLYTLHLTIETLSAGELENIAVRCTSPVQRDAFMQCAELVRVNSRNYAWYTQWVMRDNSTGDICGFCGFTGLPNADLETFVVCSVKGQFFGRGLESEAVAALSEWALGRDNCYFVGVQVALEDEQTYDHLELYGFRRDDYGDIIIYRAERKYTKMFLWYAVFGAVVGIALGAAVSGQILAPLMFGAFCGLVAGFILDRSDRKRRVPKTGLKAENNAKIEEDNAKIQAVLEEETVAEEE